MSEEDSGVYGIRNEYELVIASIFIFITFHLERKYFHQVVFSCCFTAEIRRSPVVRYAERDMQ